MRCYTKQHQFYCGIDLPACTMDVCILDQPGEILLHRNMPASPETFLKAIAPYRDDRVVAVEGIVPWYWLADLCPREGSAFVWGHALSMKAMHGGKAQNDKIDAPKIAGLLRGGLLPQASVAPAAMRATRDLWRRRMPLMRQRAELLAHVQSTNSQYNLPEMGKKIAYKAKRAGVAERFPDPAVQKSIEVDWTLLDYDDRLRIPRVQDFVSYCRLGKGAKASAGTRYGTAGTKIGQADLKGAFAEAAILLLRNHAQGQKSLARLEQNHGQGKALTILAHKLARAVYDMLLRDTVFEMDTFLNGAGSRAGEPAASLDTHGLSLNYCP